MRLSRYAKAIVAALIAGLGAMATAVQDDVISSQEWITIVIAALSALGVTWAVPNRTAEREKDVL